MTPRKRSEYALAHISGTDQDNNRAHATTALVYALFDIADAIREATAPSEVGERESAAAKRAFQRKHNLPSST
jgi:hypothetical protein